MRWARWRGSCCKKDTICGHEIRLDPRDSVRLVGVKVMCRSFVSDTVQTNPDDREVVERN
jgi:hypothetical protein